MAKSSIPLSAGPILWGIGTHARHRSYPNRGYWYDNRGRQPFGLMVFQYTLTGHMVFRDSAGDHDVGPGQAALFAYGEPTAYGLTAAHSQPYECWWFHFVGAGLAEHWAMLRRRHSSVLTLGPDSGITDRLSELARLASPASPTDLLRLARLVNDFVLWLIEWAELSLYRLQSPVERAVEQILRLPTQALPLKALAQMHGCSREHLSRAFHDRVGMSPGTYLAQAKLEHALRLLRQTDLPISQVAQEAGFHSSHTLARRVRHATGASPSRLRQKCAAAPAIPLP